MSPIAEGVRLQVKLRGHVRREGRHWSAGCPSINVYSQGATREEAQRCLQEAVELWFESCVERGTLEEAMRECGFRPARWSEAARGHEVVSEGQVADYSALLGTAFPLTVSVPAYQAAAFLGEANG
jgi:predicted RNase H-like HicB family nuclease